MQTQTTPRQKPPRGAPTLAIGTQTRFHSLRAADAAPPVDINARTATFSFSSENPVDRWFGEEILSHDASAPDFTRLNDSANLLFNHNWDDVIGVVEKAWIDNKRGYCTVRFAKTVRGDEMLGMVADGILRNVSFAYQVNAYTANGEGAPDDYADDESVYTATSWMAYEISMVTVPADQTIGVGRASERQLEIDVPITRNLPATPAAPEAEAPPPPAIAVIEKGYKMNEQEIAVAAANAAAAKAQKQFTDDALAAERLRVASIEAICEKHGISADRRREMVSSGASIELAQGIALNEILARGAEPLASLGGVDIGLTEKEKSSYSMIRAINAIVSSDWTKAGFERSVSNALAQSRGTPARNNAFLMPTNLPFHVPGAQNTRAAYQVGTPIQGGNLVATNLLAGSFIEILRNASVTGQLGATYLTGLVGKIDIPRRTAATGTYWVGESTAITEAEATFDKVSLTPKTIAARSIMSRLALLQTTPDVEMLARMDLMAQMALGVDLAALSGAGTGNQPTGIVNQSGVVSVIGGANGANLSFDTLIQLKYGIKVANAVQQNLAFAMNSKSIGYLSTLKASTGQYLWEPQGGLTTGSPDKVKGSPYAESQQIRSNLTKGTAAGICSEAIYGNWSELLIGEWGVMEILLNPYDSTGFNNGDVVIRAMQTLDIAVRHGPSFAVTSDALTPGF